MNITEYRGVRNLVIAKVLTDGASYSTDKLQKLAGAQAIVITPTESSEAHYYDNVPAIVVDSEGVDTVTLTVSVLDLKTRALIEGREYDEAADMLVKTPKKSEYFAIGFIGEKTDGTEEINLLYKGKFSGGAVTHNTKNDGTEATNVEYTFSSIYPGASISKGKTAKNVVVTIGDKITEAAVFGTFTDDVSTSEILTPDEIAALVTAA